MTPASDSPTSAWPRQNFGALLVAWLGCALLIGLRYRSVVESAKAIEAAVHRRPAC